MGNVLLSFLPQEENSLQDYHARTFDGERKQTDFQATALNCEDRSQNDINLTIHFFFFFY